MLKVLFGKKKSPEKPTPRQPDNSGIDDEETIVINLSGSEAAEPVSVTLELPDDQTAPAATEAVKPVAAVDEDETIIMTAADTNQQSDETQAISPTAGWLCITSDAGRDQTYPVSPGRNKIGRGASNQIALDIGDGMISQDGHAILVADPKAKKFHLVPGDSTNLAYINDEAVLQPAELSDRDNIQIGQTTLVFIQYYGNYVDWA